MAIEHLLELDDIMMIPSPTNSGLRKNINLFVNDLGDATTLNPQSLPLFTSPMNGIIDENNCKIWADQGVKPIIPRTVPLEIRKQTVTSVWTAFSVAEVENLWLMKDQRSVQAQFHVCIDCGNGHDIEMIKMAAKLKQGYQGQMQIMAGNIGNPEGYQHYCRAGIDYVRVGISSGSLVDENHFGFHYPMASLLMEITKSRKLLASQGTPITKVIADGGIQRHSDILKAISLGADYVMCGREFIQLLEASGTIYKKLKDPSTGKEFYDEIMEKDYASISPTKLSSQRLFRTFCGNTSLEIQAIRAGFGDYSTWRKSKPNEKPKGGDSGWEWVKVTSTLDQWVREFKEVAMYGMMMSGADSWDKFRQENRYVAI